MAPRLYSAERRWLVALLAAPMALALLLLEPGLNVTLRSAESHFVVVTICTLIGIALAFAVLNAAHVLGDGRALLVGAAFFSLAAGFCVHALATPNVLFAQRIFAVAWSGLFGQIASSLTLALSGLISPRTSNWLVRRYWLWLSLLGLAWITYAVLALSVPGSPAPTIAPPPTAGGAPEHDHGSGLAAILGLLTPQQLAGGTGLLMYAVALGTYGRFYQRQRTQAGLALIGGIGLLAEALFTQIVAGSYTLVFWLYHVLEFAGIATLAYGVVLGLRSGNARAGMLEILLLPGTILRMHEGYARTLERLVSDLERGATLGETATEDLQRRFSLSESQLAVLRRAAQAVAEERQRRRQLEELNTGLQRLERDRRQLTQLIIHDLKNPISAIGGYLELLQLSKPDASSAELIAYAQTSVHNLRILVDDLLDIGQLEAGQMKLQRSQVELAKLLHSCAEQLAAWARQSGIQVAVVADYDLPPVSADRRLLERLVLNLLSNAIKHTEEGSQVVLGARQSPDADAALIEVADNGPGIAAEHLEAIFDSYISGGAGAGQHSRGLGLTLCRLVAEAHGGTIAVESAPGSGSLFQVSLPFAPPA